MIRALPYPGTTRLRHTHALIIALSAISSVHCAHPQDHADPPSPRAAPVLASAPPAQPAPIKPPKPKVIVFVWDGLRPDSVTPQNTPNLVQIRDHDGVNFRDHHAVYPTFTMMNAAAFATGAYPGHHGFYGNTEYQPGPSGSNADGDTIDFSRPVFTEDHGVLRALDAFYRASGGALFSTGTLFQAAHAAGLRTAAIGKIGPAFLQDYRPDEARSVILDENIALPFSFARGLQSAGIALPANAARYPFPDGQTLTLAPNNGKPSAALVEKIVRLKDGATPDPRSALGSAHDAANDYLMQVYLDYVLPKFDPEISFIWLRNPDSTEHQFGPGSANYLDALRDQDALLGKLQRKLSELGLRENTDLLIVSDHAHSTVGGDPRLFPLRALTGDPDGHGEVGAPDPKGYAVSGEIRTADILSRAGFRHIYDGGGCLLDPVLSGIRKDGSLVYPTQKDSSGICAAHSATKTTASATVPPASTAQTAATFYSMPSYRVPDPPPKDAIIIATNGGSEYFYVLSQSRQTVQALVLALQEREAFGAIFVRSNYGAIPGTLPLSAINAEGTRNSPPTPDLIVSFAWDDGALTAVNGDVPGTEYSSVQRYRGIHGSFSPRDVHNSFFALGPHFKPGFGDALPTGNVDLAPTIAALLGFHFDAPDGRVLREALVGQTGDYQVEVVDRSSDPIHLSKICKSDDPPCAHPAGPAIYGATLHQKILTERGTNLKYSYFDQAKATRRSP